METEEHPGIQKLRTIREKIKALHHSHHCQAFQWEERLVVRERLLDQREIILAAGEEELKCRQEMHSQEVQRTRKCHQLEQQLPNASDMQKPKARALPLNNFSCQVTRCGRKYYRQNEMGPSMALTRPQRITFCPGLPTRINVLVRANTHLWDRNALEDSIAKILSRRTSLFHPGAGLSDIAARCKEIDTHEWFRFVCARYAADNEARRNPLPNSSGMSCAQEAIEHYRRKITAVFREQKGASEEEIDSMFRKYGERLAELYWATCVKSRIPCMDENVIFQLGQEDMRIIIFNLEPSLPNSMSLKQEKNTLGTQFGKAVNAVGHRDRMQHSAELLLGQKSAPRTD